jgi:hypothetical protein
MGVSMTREYFSSKKERESWLQDCVAMFRDAVQARRAATGDPTPICIAQIAMEFGIKESRGKKFFYNELFGVSRETAHAMKLAALRECDTRERLLSERLEAARARRRQYELELSGKAKCGCGTSGGRASATGAGTDA